jgi:VTC domain-containing protein
MSGLGPSWRRDDGRSFRFATVSCREEVDMAYTHRMQTNRRELKYIIPEQTAIAIRNYIRPFLEPDEFADPLLDYSYWIHSLYLDNDHLVLAKATMEGLKNRFKLRVRFYTDDPAHPVFFEIKRRVNDTILKERTAVHRAAGERILRRNPPSRSDLVKYTPKNLAALERFCALRDSIYAVGKAFVSYKREAYVSPHDDSVRVTFDRCLTAGRYNGENVKIDPIDNWCQPQIEGVVLELKFTDRFPHWMGDLCRIFGLQRTTMPKYVHCIHSVERETIVQR